MCIYKEIKDKSFNKNTVHTLSNKALENEKRSIDALGNSSVKLQQLGIIGSLLNLLTEPKYSSCVPQESVLCSRIFKIYVNDVAMACERNFTWGYEDPY